MKLAACFALATGAVAVRQELVTEIEVAAEGGPSDATCHASVRNSVVRECASWMINSCKTETCKCPTSFALVGDDAACKEADRKFDPNALNDKGCRCELPLEDGKVYTPVSELYPQFNCPTKFASLQDMVDRAHEWCNSDLIPESRRVPPKLRGLYYFMGLGSQNFAFCPSISEWDGENLILKSVPWTHFLYHVNPTVPYQDGEVPKMAVSDSHFENSNMPFASGQLVYTFKFKDDTLSFADIIPNQRFMASISKFTFVELDKTPDGKAVATEPGDVYARPVHILSKKFTDIFAYHPIRITYDDGRINEANVELMKELEPEGEIVRYSQTC